MVQIHIKALIKQNIKLNSKLKKKPNDLKVKFYFSDKEEIKFKITDYPEYNDDKSH